MEWYAILILLLLILVALLLTGMPVAFALLVADVIGAYFFMGGSSGLRALSLSMFDALTNFSLAPIPLFIFMGEILFLSGLAVKTLEVLDQWLGRLPGRLALLTTGGGTLFAVLSGSTMANTATLGSLLLPQMTAREYHKTLALGAILGSGGLAMIIPPSGLAVVYGSIAKISIGKLLIAGVIPGLIMATLYAIYIIVRCVLYPNDAPQYQPERLSLQTRLIRTLHYMVPVVAIVFLVLGLIFLGVATPTEAAALGASGSLLLALLYRGLTLTALRKAALSTVKLTVMVLFILAASQGYSQLMAFTGASRGIVKTLVELPVSPLVILLLMQLAVLVLGMFIDQVSIMMITVPLYMPVVFALKWDPIWFAILMLINLEIGGTSPPFGLNLFVMKGVAPPDTSMGDIYRAALPFIVCDIVSMIILVLFPVLVTWLPQVML